MSAHAVHQATSEGSSALAFVDEVTDCYSGQTNHRLTVSTPDGHTGTLEYTVFRGQPSISMVAVPLPSRRQGFGSALIRHLQGLFPDKEIEWGFMTPEGVALKAALPKNIVETEAAPLIRDLGQVRDRLAELEGMADAGQKLSIQQLDAWNDLHDRENELESQIGCDPGFKTIIETNLSALPTKESDVLASAIQARNLVGMLTQACGGPRP